MASRHDTPSRLQNSTLLTQSFVGENDGRNDHFLGLTIYYIFLAFWVGVANSSQIINVVFSPGLRSQPKNILICNVCVAELIMGVFLCPMYTDTLMQGTWRHDLTTYIVYELTFYCQVCITTLAVLVVAVERLYFLLTPNMMDGSGTRCMTALLVLLPWTIGASLVVPIFKFGTITFSNEVILESV
ncbi:G protein-coupled receptor 84 [Elysia marginata]|uniref:G protein-coupled receptor 84 n=1 Tax=Elysia marginata TaxID=1093978 RepID=A0AAV4F1R3_9GAST|nr:G protein-coupled receptor 84 [Elysia marginata]